MRREDYVIELRERIVRRQRFLLEYIKRRSRNPLLSQNFNERRLIDQLAASDVDKIRGRFHRPQMLRPNHAVLFRRQVRMNAYEIGIPENFFKRR